MTHRKAVCCTSPSVVVSQSLFYTWWADKKVNRGRSEVRRTESRSHVTICPSCGRSTHVLATETKPAQQSTTRPLRKINLEMTWIIHGIFFCYRQYKTLKPDALEPAWNSHSSCRGCVLFDVWFVHLGCINFILPYTLLKTRANIRLTGSIFCHKRITWYKKYMWRRRVSPVSCRLLLFWRL